MYIQDAELVLESIFMAHRDNKVSYRHVPLLHGPAGIGKTQLIKYISTKLGMACINVRVGQLESADLIGIPRSKKRFLNKKLEELFAKAEKSDGLGKFFETTRGLVSLFASTDSYMVYDLPNFLPHYLKDEKGNVITVIDEDTKEERKVLDIDGLGDMVVNRKELEEMFDGDMTKVKGAVIFLDEINRIAGDDMKQSIFQLPEAYKMHTYKVPEGCAIVAAANPNTNDYQVSEIDQDKAFMDRFMHLKLSTNVESWMSWAGRKGIHHGLMSFYNAMPDALQTNEKPYQLPIHPTPRSAELLNTLLTEVELPTNDSIRREVFMGILGAEFGPMLQKHLKENITQVPKAEEIILNYSKHQPLIQSMAKANNQDFLNQVWRNVYTYCQDAKNWDEIKNAINKPDPKNPGQMIPGNLDLYILDLPSEMAMTYVQQLIKIRVDNKPLNDILGDSDVIFKYLKQLSKKADATK